MCLSYAAHVLHDDASCTIAIGLQRGSPSIKQARLLFPLLDCEERRRANSIVHEGVFAQYVQAHALLRRLVSRWADCEPERVRFRRECLLCGSREHGRVIVDEPPEVYVSLSRRPGLAVVAAGVGTGWLGIDVESASRPVELWAEIAGSTFSLAERTAFESATDAELARNAAQLWCRKEAVGKACGRGLAVRLPELDVLCSEEPDWCEVRLIGELWFVRDVAVGGDFVCSVAAQRPVSVQTFDIDDLLGSRPAVAPD